MEIVLYFLLATFLSFIGSLQPGPVNLFVLRKSMQRHSYWSAAIGGSIPEILYCGLAVWFSSLIEFIPLQSLRIFLIIFFVVTAFYLLKVESSQMDMNDDSSDKKHKLFFQSFVLAIFNPLLLVYWISMLSYVNLYSLSPVGNISNECSFILGTAFGAFLLLICIGHFAKKIQKRFSLHSKRINSFIAIVFILLAFKELVTLIK
ncbi:MAG TPA: LysE family transporter [Bacteroidia bacterium]|nr:LysE family transporter [Bacteroidia bacterium]